MLGAVEAALIVLLVAMEAQAQWLVKILIGELVLALEAAAARRGAPS